MPLESCIVGHRLSKSPREPRTVDYSPRKWPEMLEITSFDDAARVVYRGSRGIEILRGPENRGHSHENGQKCSKSRVLTMPLESCTEGHGASKSSRDLKTVDYSPRKRPEMPENTSFDDKARVMYRGSWVSKSSRDPKTMDYSPRKRAEMPEITSFDGTA